MNLSGLSQVITDAHGRFTAVGSLLNSGKPVNPQTFNRYVYSTASDYNGVVDGASKISRQTVSSLFES